MALGTLDWFIVSIFFLLVLTIGWVASRTAGESSSQFFLGGFRQNNEIRLLAQQLQFLAWAEQKQRITELEIHIP